MPIPMAWPRTGLSPAVSREGVGSWTIVPAHRGRRFHPHRTRKAPARRLAALLDVSRLVASSLDPHDIFEIVADKMSDLVGATEVTIFVLEEAEQTLRPLVARTGERYYDHVMRMRLKWARASRASWRRPASARASVTQRSTPRRAGHGHARGRARRSSACRSRSRTGWRRDHALALRREPVRARGLRDRHHLRGHCSVAIANARLYADLRRAFEDLHAAQSSSCSRRS